MRRVELVLPLVLVACVDPAGRPVRRAGEPAPRYAPAAAAVEALKAGRFEAAEAAAGELLAREAAHPEARLVRAVARYRRAAHDLTSDLLTILAGAVEARALNGRLLRASLEAADRELAAVDEDLAAAARDPGVSLELCLACWRVDWNRSGEVDPSDERLLEIELDADGRPIPEGDPRRRPTFRFDIGDVYWARAMVSFQRGLIAVGRAYRWEDLGAVFTLGAASELRVRLIDAPRLLEARAFFLAGLELSARERREYLAETDDDREWLPSPTQKDHPLPLPVDAALYETWDGCVGDLGRLLRGEEGISLAEAAALLGLAPGGAAPAGGRSGAAGFAGFLDVSRIFDAPADIVLRPEDIDELEDRPSGEGLRAVLGSLYVAKMKPSPLIARLARMKSEIDRGGESLERKLRYLFWVN